MIESKAALTLSFRLLLWCHILRSAEAWSTVPMIVRNPIAGVILKVQNGKFWGVQVFTGVLMFASAVL